MAMVVWSAEGRSDVYLREQFGQNLIYAVVRDEDAAFVPVFAGPELILHTTLEAPRGRVLKVPLADLRRERWREIVPQSDGVIEGVAAVGHKVLVTQMREVHSRTTVYDTEGLQYADIVFPTIGTLSPAVGNWEDDAAFFTFTSFDVPAAIYRYDVATSERAIWWRPDVPVDAIAVRQVWYRSKDGTRVPMFLAHRPGLVPDGATPTLLTGNGGFNDAVTPSFSAIAVALVERGGIYAVANLRGGSEFGDDWHRAGMREKKQNTFDDFIAAAEWLIAQGYTNPSKLAVEGGGNGGLLVGASMTQRPELFQAVVSASPVLDMVRYHHFSLARSGVPEYGSAEDPEQFKWLIDYSPYHHVRAGTDYPAVLLEAADDDSQVAPLHARKMAAQLQAASAGRRPVMLLYDTKSRRENALPMDALIENATDQLMFLLWQLRVPAEAR
ncbi:MAG: prolyl oligopeptidase family serine peptidase, partial [Longimicrobiales bacterium]